METVLWLLGLSGALATTAATIFVLVVLGRELARLRAKKSPLERRRALLGSAIGTAGGLLVTAALILAAEGVWRTPLLLGLLAVGLAYMVGMAFMLPLRELVRARRRRA